MSIEKFKSLFTFNPSRQFHVGVERECFLADRTGKIQPIADHILASLVQAGARKDQFGYELSRCQLESRTLPVQLSKLYQELEEAEYRLKPVLESMYLQTLHTEVGPADMPLDVYPDPTGRYQRITENMPNHVLLAACRVIGTHVHVGMRDHEMALRVYNYVITKLNELCEVGNGSFGERLAIYRQMAPDYNPKAFESWNDYYETAAQKGFVHDPRKCWTLIRISVHGTIEFRMFGATDSIPRIVSWATRCHELCREALVFS